MSAFSSSDILSSLANSDSPHAMATLTTLDLRCSKLDSRAIIAIIQNAPQLREINLKGVHFVTLDVLHHLATCCKGLESLDVSGCWNVSIDDVGSYVENLYHEGAARFKVLRLNGLHFRNEGLIPSDPLTPLLDKLSNLETLSLQRCRQVASTILISACEAFSSQSRTSTIRHLNLSGCTGLRADIFPVMSGLFPELRYLELAGMPGLFQEHSQSDRTAFNRFLETLPKLEKLDVEETCGTCLDDSTLRILARAPNLTHLQIGFATKITPGAMIEFIRDCPTLKVFEADVSLISPVNDYADIPEHSSQWRGHPRISISSSRGRQIIPDRLQSNLSCRLPTSRRDIAPTRWIYRIRSYSYGLLPIRPAEESSHQSILVMEEG
jgi:F-box/leucine-rich repeat protein 2/20